MAARRAAPANVTTAEVEKFEAKSTSAARDLFYTFDAIRRFQARRIPGEATATSGTPRLSATTRWAGQHAGVAARARSAAVADRSAVTQRRSHRGAHRRNRQGATRFSKRSAERDRADTRIPELDNIQVGGPAAITGDFRPIVDHEHRRRIFPTRFSGDASTTTSRFPRPIGCVRFCCRGWDSCPRRRVR